MQLCVCVCVSLVVKNSQWFVYISVVAILLCVLLLLLLMVSFIVVLSSLNLKPKMACTTASSMILPPLQNAISKNCTRNRSQV